MNDPRTPEQLAYIAATVARMKAEIIRDIKAGIHPATIRDFGDLHTHCDANEYGGLCEDSVDGELKGLDLLAHTFPDPEGSQDFGTINSEAGMDVANEMQEAVHQWLARGDHQQELS